MISNQKKIAILFLSCDTYADLWEPLFYQFWKCWKDCPYTLYLGSNTKKLSDKRIKTILSGKDVDWSSSLLAILEQIEEKYIFLWLDDIIPISSIETTSFQKIFAYMEEHHAVHIHMKPMPKPDVLQNDHIVSRYEKNMPYRVNVQGFWDVEILKKLLIQGESPWSFEIMGSYRSSYMDGFYCASSPLFEYIHAVEKGKLFPKAVSYCKDHHIPLNTKDRKQLVSGGWLKSLVQVGIFSMMIQIPWKLRVRLMNTLRKIFISY